MNMRAAIDVSKRLLEAPGLVSGAMDFGLDNPGSNWRIAQTFSQPDAEILHDGPRVRLIKVGSDEGAIGLIRRDTGLLDYYVKFETKNYPQLGGTVTQVELWRGRDAALTFPRVTEFVFFDVLIPRYGAIMSDSLQTVDGMNFWRRMIGLALQRDLSVSFVDFRRPSVETFDPSSGEDVLQWISRLDAWGIDDVHEDRRFVIR